MGAPASNLFASSGKSPASGGSGFYLRPPAVGSFDLRVRLSMATGG